MRENFFSTFSTNKNRQHFHYTIKEPEKQVASQNFHKIFLERLFDKKGRAVAIALTVAPIVTGRYNGSSLPCVSRIAGRRLPVDYYNTLFLTKSKQDSKNFLHRLWPHVAQFVLSFG